MSRGNQATRMLATFRPSRRVKMVWRVANVSVTSRTCRTREEERHARHPRNKLRGCRACRACPRGCHEDARRKLLPWNLSLRRKTNIISNSSAFKLWQNLSLNVNLSR